MSDILVSGTIVQALPIQQGVSQRTGNQWARASYIIEHEHGQYPRRMVFDVSNAKIQELNLQVGENVTLHLNCDCREYPENSGKFFNSIEAWKVDRVQQYAPQPGGYAPQPGYQQPAPQYQQPVQQPTPGYAPFPPQPTTAAPQPAPFPQQPTTPVAPQPVQPQQTGLPFPPAQ